MDLQKNDFTGVFKINVILSNLMKLFRRKFESITDAVACSKANKSPDRPI